MTNSISAVDVMSGEVSMSYEELMDSFGGRNISIRPLLDVLKTKGYTYTDSAVIVEDVFESIKELIQAGIPVRITGFGAFGLNPKKQEVSEGTAAVNDTSTMTYKVIPKFTISRQFKTSLGEVTERYNHEFGHDAGTEQA